MIILSSSVAIGWTTAAESNTSNDQLTYSPMHSAVRTKPPILNLTCHKFRMCCSAANLPHPMCYIYSICNHIGLFYSLYICYLLPYLSAAAEEGLKKLDAL